MRWPWSPNATSPSLDDRRPAAARAGDRGSTQPALRSMLASPAIAIATMLGIGFFPIWPGTVGSALALPLVYVARSFDPVAKAVIYLVLFLGFAAAAHRAGRQLGKPDHEAIICDETWGMAIVWECTPADFRWMLTTFLLFRVFDAAKPWPICAVDRHLKNGFGVMLDDGLAALAAILSIFAVRMAIVASGLR